MTIQTGKGSATSSSSRSPGPAAALRAPRIGAWFQVPEAGAIAAAILLFGFFAIASAGRGFVSVAGTASWLNTASELGIIAVPAGLLMIAGEFDLSIGSMVGAGSVTVGLLTGYLHYPLWLSLVVAGVAALAVGIGNGLLVTRTGLPSFIVTLAANLIVAGLGLAISQSVADSTSITVTTSGALPKLFDGSWGAFSISNLWWLLVAGVAAWVLSQTRTGSWIAAVGGDTGRARRAGVMTSRLKIALFVCTSLAATFVGVMQAVQFNTGDPTTGQGYVFEVPIVVVIGGVLLTGGYGTIPGVAIGTVIYGIINAGLFYTGWNTDYSQVVIGALMVVAVLTNNGLRKLALRVASPREVRS